MFGVIPKRLLWSFIHISGTCVIWREMPFLLFWYHIAGVSCILREILLSVICPCLRNVCHFKGKVCYRGVSTTMFEEHLAFYGRCHLSSCVHIGEAPSILWELHVIFLSPYRWRMWEVFFIVMCPYNRSALAFSRIAFSRRVSLFDVRLAFYRRFLLASRVHLEFVLKCALRQSVSFLLISLILRDSFVSSFMRIL